MAWGISPRKLEVVPLGAYSADHYLTLLYHAMQNMGWHISYFDHDGIIAYTNISWASYAEEVSARIRGNMVVIKSECVGYQGLFTDYGKNEKNLELLFGEIDVREVVLRAEMEESVQKLMDSVPENQFVQLADPPLAAKEDLRFLPDWFVPTKKYLVTPVLVYLNILAFIASSLAIAVSTIKFLNSKEIRYDDRSPIDDIYLAVGINGRTPVLHGEVWRLITGTFLHGGFMHLLGNMIVLVYIGSLIEWKLGRWNFLFLYLFTGIVASMTSVLWHTDGYALGASGAIFGLFGILLALLSTDFYERNARRALLISTGIFVAFHILPLGKGIDHAAHFGGLISGYVFGWIAYFGLKKNRKGVNTITAGLVSAVLSVLFVVIGMATAKDYQLKEYKQLVDKSENYSRNLYAEFYDDSLVTRDQKLALFKRKTLPQIKLLQNLEGQYLKLTLPEKERKEASYRAQIVKLQAKYFGLLYREFEEKTPKYRPQIIAATDSINKLRAKWTEDDKR
ncbi:rhomboid family intramembrane serine protease [Mucilaginibacter sp. RS28]|uniref:Rhomboid family intramembrane serine protease n=1 Tax=Mucilaginibacter straminoryzae TaxID=2932774 RepID=A0A9X2BAE1_9SPHI|nr:rhomboid family intramembrane serine protease [Mucilaginibacter straminoryzae]MCJ8210720.1 rhomboid family intramembrane serine protease [Mucilaginibacter straminoryzae]